MPVPMKKPHTEKKMNSVSAEKNTNETPLSLEDFIKDTFGDLPTWAITLRGYRNREGISQASLGELLGINQANISKMESGKRPIGKTLAKRLADFFKTDYRLFL